MKCKEAKRLSVLELYGELGEVEKARLHDHLEQCRDCAVELILTKRVFAVLDAYEPAAEPSADWDKAWDRIQTGISNLPAQRLASLVKAPWKEGRDGGASPPDRWKETRSKGFRPRVTWAYAGTAVALVLVAGIFIGRYVLMTGSQPSGMQTLAVSTPPPNGIRPAFAAHLDDLKPILLDYAHYVPGEKNGSKILVDEDVLRGFVLQNILLKRKLAEKDPAAAELLDDLDLVLKEMTNRGSQDPQDPARIRDLIEQRGVLFKMEIMKKI